jgi:hypothetical protein
MKIRLTEGQYKRIFLNEDYAYCNMHQGNWSNSYQAPRRYILKDPFKDGYDYQWKIWSGDCSRSWIRRKIKYRDENPYDLHEKSPNIDRWGEVLNPSANDWKKISDRLNKYKNDYWEKNHSPEAKYKQRFNEDDIEFRLISYLQTWDLLDSIGLNVSGSRGNLIPYKRNQKFTDVKDIPSDNYLMSRTAINAMKYLNDLISNKVSVRGMRICVTKIDMCEGAAYVTSNTYSINLANIISSKKVGKYPASWVVEDNGFSYNWGKIVKNLENSFKGDENSVKSSLFTDGWWNYFTTAYGVSGENSFTQLVNIIKGVKSTDIAKIESINKYKKGTSIYDIPSMLSDCFTDYHCVLDIASIATLAIPGIGLAVSAGLDFINAASYGVEGLTAKDKANRDAAYLAGSLTLLGGLLGGGYGQTKKILKAGKINPKIYQYADEVMSKIKLEIPNAKNLKNIDPTKGNLLQRSFSKNKMDETLAKIYAETQEKYGLKQSEMLVAHDLLKDLSKIDPSVAQKYAEALNTVEGKMKGSIEKGNLLRLGNDSKFQKTLIENNGDIVTALNKHLKKVAKREAVMEASLFVALTSAMEHPSVQKWIANKYNYIKNMNRTDIRGMVEKEGYDWAPTKELFGSDGKVNDNSLLKKAWLKGWRPWPEGKEKPTEEDIAIGLRWLLDNPKYQTEKFKGGIGQYGNTKKQRYLVNPENEKDKEEGVIYIEDKEIVDIINNTDNNITDEELKLSQNASL